METKTDNSEGRGPDGKFSKGNNFGVAGGRPKVWNKAEYLNVIKEVVTPEIWGVIIKQAIKDATEGSVRDRIAAREWLGKYLLPQRTEVEFSGKEEQAVRIIAVEGFNGWDTTINSNSFSP